MSDSHRLRRFRAFVVGEGRGGWKIVPNRRGEVVGLLLGLLLLVGLVGCGASSTPTPDRGGATVAVPTVVPSPTPLPLPPDASVVARIRARGKLVVGVRYDQPLYGFVTPQGDLAGFDVDLARELARRWLGDPEAVRFVQVTSATWRGRLTSGEVHLVSAALPHTREAEAEVAFSQTYDWDGPALLVREDAPIQGPADLVGRSAAVVSGSEAEAALLEVVGRQGITVTLHSADDYLVGGQALLAGQVDAVAGPRLKLMVVAYRLGGLRVTAPFAQTRPLALGLPPDDGSFRDLVNFTLQEMAADGTWATLYRQWFHTEPPALARWPGSPPFTFATAPATRPAPRNGLEAIQGRGVLRAGVRMGLPPFAFDDGAGNPAGYEVDLARALAARWLGDPLAVQFVTVTQETALAALAGGQVDLVVALPHTLEAEAQADFGPTHYRDGIGLLIGPNIGAVEPTDLQGAVVAVAPGAQNALKVWATGHGVTLTPRPVDGPAAALELLQTGEVAAYADERVTLLRLVLGYQAGTLWPDRLTERPLAIAVPQGDEGLRVEVALALQEMAVNGSYGELYARWFGTDPPPAIEIWPP